MARPNVLLFGDDAFVRTRRNEQRHGFLRWLANALEGRVGVLELGAGVELPTVRRTGEELAARTNVQLIRINSLDPQTPGNGVSLPGRAREILRTIDDLVVTDCV